jgi:hypothetical protein
LLYWSGWTIISKLFVAVIIGFLIYLSRLIYLKELKDNLPTWKNATWILFYLAGLCVLTRYGEFDGGLKIIPVGIDFAVLAVFSMIVLWASERYMLSPEQAKKNISLILAEQQGSKQVTHSYDVQPEPCSKEG